MRARHSLGFLLLGTALSFGCSSAPADREMRADRWVVSDQGVGPVRIGTPRGDLVTAGGAVLGGSGGCEYIRPPGAPQGLAAMVVDGSVRRIDVIEPGIETTTGIGVGSTSDELRRAYPWASTQLPHKYVGGGHYFVVNALDAQAGPSRLVFETDAAGIVTRYRVGMVPQVDWVEGCS